MKILYLDCFSGISGDMLLGALVDAGLNFEIFKKELNKLKLNFIIEKKKVLKNNISGTKIIIKSNDKKERGLKEINKIIENSLLSKKIKQESMKIFYRLAEVEAKIHNKRIDKIHFHELGAVDSIVDIVGAIIGFELVGIDAIYCSAIPLGSGFVNTRHGKLPVPAPALADLLKGFPVVKTQVRGELVTPTGALIISTFAKYSEIPQMKISSIGYGAGNAHFEHPNLLRIFIGEASDEEQTIILETNIDDMNPQIYPYVIEKLLKAGAREAFIQPIIMKKGRLGTLLKVICDDRLKEKLSELIFNETTTFGIRMNKISRICLEREFKKVKTKFGDIKVKTGKFKGKIKTVSPEYEDCKRIADKKNIPLKIIYDEVKKNI